MTGLALPSFIYGISIMGLDMYLSANFSARAFVWPENMNSDSYITNEFIERSDSIDETIAAQGLPTDLPIEHQWNHYSVSYPVAKWRKANAIHKWFIDNCNDGRDNSCDDIYVNIDHLKELLATIKLILKSKDRKKAATEHLPPCSGFFYGSTDIDNYYFQDLEYTQRRLEAIIQYQENQESCHYSKPNKHGDTCGAFDSFTYQGSW